MVLGFILIVSYFISYFPHLVSACFWPLPPRLVSPVFLSCPHFSVCVPLSQWQFFFMLKCLTKWFSFPCLLSGRCIIIICSFGLPYTWFSPEPASSPWSHVHCYSLLTFLLRNAWDFIVVKNSWGSDIGQSVSWINRESDRKLPECEWKLHWLDFEWDRKQTLGNIKRQREQQPEIYFLIKINQGNLIHDSLDIFHPQIIFCSA